MVYIPFICFVCLFVIQYMRQRAFNIGSFITMIYIVNSFFAIVFYNQNPNLYENYLGIIPPFLYCSLLVLCILPFYRIRSDKIREYGCSNPKLFNFVGWLLIVLAVLQITSYATGVRSVFEESDFHDLYDESAMSYSLGSGSGQSWYLYILGMSGTLSHLTLFMFFYSLILYPSGRFLFKSLLFVGSLIAVVASILTASRNPSVYWIIMFLGLVVFFHQSISKSGKKFLVCVGIIGFVAIAFYMLLVTESRFGAIDSGGSDSLVYYAGQNYLEFCKVYEKYHHLGFTIDRVLPITSKYLLGHGDFNMTTYRDFVGSKIGASVGVFFTFLGDAMIDFGKFGMIIYALLFSWLCNLGFKRKHLYKISFSQALIFLILVRQITLGSFAYVYKEITSSLFIVSVLAFAYIMSRYKDKTL